MQTISLVILLDFAILFKLYTTWPNYKSKHRDRGIGSVSDLDYPRTVSIHQNVPKYIARLQLDTESPFN